MTLNDKGIKKLLGINVVCSISLAALLLAFLSTGMGCSHGRVVVEREEGTVIIDRGLDITKADCLISELLT